MADPGGDARLRRFLPVYALAWAGTAIAYMPFLILLLPMRVAQLAGAGPGIGWVAQLAFLGALAASSGHILFGWLSDISGRRRPWIAAGLLLSTGLLVAMDRPGDLPTLVAMVIAWQFALNMMMAPLAALAGDVVPDTHKGILGGLMAFAPGCGALAGTIVTWPGLAGPEARLALVAALVVLCLAPVLMRPLPAPVPAPPPADVTSAGLSADGVRRMWLARLAVQIAEATLFAYLYFWFRSIDAGVSDNRIANLFAVILLVSAPLSLWAGRWSDRSGRPFLPLRWAALGAAAGLLVMASAQGLAVAMAGFSLFSLASAGFLALHSAQTLRVLRRPDRRGRDLGLFNLTNTIPSLIMPWLTLGMMPGYGFSGVFVALALLSLLGAILLAPRRG
ncbi:MAG: MFS transporter [Alphaproteobacteria bacterium PA4]|nr:MAG: MFS transporter [Alphaproteobacteria bacterium PA4]